MSRLALVLAAVVLAVPLHPAISQTLDARRMAMGGVTLPSKSAGSVAANVAYRAVPPLPGRSTGMTLPIGVVSLLSDPPTFDPDDPEFNVYELANLFYNPPWNLQLVSPEAPSNDIVVTVARNRLSVQLGDVADIFPEDGSRLSAFARLPTLGFGIKSYFVGVSAVAEYENVLRLNDALHGALANGEDFLPNTEYGLFDDARGQAAAALEAGWAGGLAGTGDPRTGDGSGLFAGARVRLLRGLAYADARNSVSFATRDTLFGNSSIDLQYEGLIHDAGPSGGGWGRGLDLGLVWMKGGLEVGLGLNDVGTRIDWRVRERMSERDSVSGDYELRTVGEDVPLTSEMPLTATLNLARRFGSTIVAADLIRREDESIVHLGVEKWFGPLALRTGLGVEDRKLQQAGGLGVRLGRIGLDVAVATHHRTISGERGVELATGLSLYP